jgi:hypothetical protein
MLKGMMEVLQDKPQKIEYGKMEMKCIIQKE